MVIWGAATGEAEGFIVVGVLIGVTAFDVLFGVEEFSASAVAAGNISAEVEQRARMNQGRANVIPFLLRRTVSGEEGGGIELVSRMI